MHTKAEARGKSILDQGRAEEENLPLSSCLRTEGQNLARNSTPLVKVHMRLILNQLAPPQEGEVVSPIFLSWRKVGSISPLTLSYVRSSRILYIGLVVSAGVRQSFSQALTLGLQLVHSFPHTLSLSLEAVGEHLSCRYLQKDGDGIGTPK